MRNRDPFWPVLLATLVLSRCVVSADEFFERSLDNWHQWRGPLATGEAPRGNPPEQFGPQTNVRWKVVIPGQGASTPVIWGNRIFILSAIETEKKVDSAKAGVDHASGTRWVSQRAEDDGPQREGDEGPTAEGGGRRETDDAPGRRRGTRGWFGRGRFGGFGGESPPANVYQFVVLCLDRNTGTTLWERVACEAVPHEGKHSTGSYAAASPVTDGRFVYCSFGSRGIFCYDMQGALKWNVDLGDMRTRHSFGEGSSPALYGETLIVNWDHEGDSFIAALDARTGREKWRTDRDEPTTWNTPGIVEHAGSQQVVVNGSNRVRSYELQTGRLIWECGGQTTNPIPSPVCFEGLAICVSGFRGYAACAIPLSVTGDVTDSDQIAWRHSKGTPYVSSAVLAGHRLFYTKDRTGILTCVDARTGKILIDQKRLPALSDIYASPVSAAGRVYFSGRDGSVVVIDGTVDEVQVLAQNDLGETIDASPAIVGDQLFIRGDKHLYCFARD